MINGQTKVIGVWDDHDYGSNNADYRLRTKYTQRDIFLDFIGEPKDTPRRLNKEQGIYQDYVVVTSQGIKVHFILLDVRFHHNQDFEGDRLGSQQYAWLERIFAEHQDSDVTLIGSGVHIIPERYLSYVEDIGQPAKQKILDLIDKYEKSGVIIMSGDVHWAQMFHTQC